LGGLFGTGVHHKKFFYWPLWNLGMSAPAADAAAPPQTPMQKAQKGLLDAETALTEAKAALRRANEADDPHVAKAEADVAAAVAGGAKAQAHVAKAEAGVAKAEYEAAHAAYNALLMRRDSQETVNEDTLGSAQKHMNALERAWADARMLVKTLTEAAVAAGGLAGPLPATFCF